MQMFRKLFVTFAISLCALPLSANAQLQFTQGEDYKQVNVEIDRSTPDIQVVEFFSYGCPYCARVDVPLGIWENEMMPENATLIRVAIPRRGKWITYAKAFYALQAIDPALERYLAPEIIKAVVYNKQNLDNDAAFIDWAVAHGVDRKQLTDLMASKEIEQAVEAALELSEHYGLESVPSLYVDGRYHLINNNAFYEKVPLLLNALITKAEEARKTPSQASDGATTSSGEEEINIFSCSLDPDANSCD